VKLTSKMFWTNSGT